MDISQAWGYGAIVFPKLCKWQGFVIPHPGNPAYTKEIGKALANAAQVEGETTPSEGTLAASAVYCLVMGQEHGLGVFASALSELLGKRFWVIDAQMDQSGGMVTQVSPLDVETPEAARAQIDSRVMPLKFGQLIQAMSAAAADPDAGEPAHSDDDQSRKPEPDR